MTLPAALRKSLGLRTGDQVFAREENGRIVLAREADERRAPRPTARQLAARRSVLARLRQPSLEELDALRAANRPRGRPLTLREIRAAIVEGRK